MNESKITEDETNKWSQILGGRLHLIYVDVRCLKCIVEFGARTNTAEKKFTRIFNHIYRVLYDRVYTNIYKLLDKRNDVMSIKNFCYKLRRVTSWKEIEEHPIYSKIKEKRHNEIAHDNQTFALNQNQAQSFYEQNKLHLSEILSFLEFIKSKLEQLMIKGGELYCFMH